jgi:hypothetical protein
MAPLSFLRGAVVHAGRSATPAVCLSIPPPHLHVFVFTITFFCFLVVLSRSHASGWDGSLGTERAYIKCAIPRSLDMCDIIVCSLLIEPHPTQWRATWCKAAVAALPHSVSGRRSMVDFDRSKVRPNPCS